MKQSAVSFTVLAAVAAMLLAPGTAAAGNAANPDAIELAPLPLPVEFKSDVASGASVVYSNAGVGSVYYLR